MYYIISIIQPNATSIMANICERLELTTVLSLHGRGTATKSMRQIWGIDSNERRVFFVIADEDKKNAFITEAKRRLYIDAPNNGIVIAVPIKSVGGGKTLAMLGGSPMKKVPEINYDYELILAVCNEGHTESVMDAGRGAGAGGGTVIHAKGTGGPNAEKLFKVSIAQEKEIVMIVARSEDKARIMTAIIENAGTHTAAGAIVFSLPVSAVEGFKN